MSTLLCFDIPCKIRRLTTLGVGIGVGTRVSQRGRYVGTETDLSLHSFNTLWGYFVFFRRGKYDDVSEQNLMKVG